MARCATSSTVPAMMDATVISTVTPAPCTKSFHLPSLMKVLLKLSAS